MAYGFQTVSGQTGAELAVSIYDQMVSTPMDVLYAKYCWRDVVPTNAIKTDINPGAQNIVQPVRDKTGSAQFMGKGASPRNIPSVSLSLGGVLIPMAWSATSAAITNEDARVYEFGALGSLAQDLNEVMHVACENLIETATMFGAPEVGFQGWLSYSGITTTTAANTGAGPSTLWVNKTAVQMVEDVNAAITYVVNATRTIMWPSHVFLPVAQYMMLSNTPMVLGNGGVFQTAMEFLKKNNTYTARTAKELTIVPIRYLAGSGANGSDRMVVQDMNPKYQFLPVSLPYKVGAPVPEALGASFYAEQKFGSYAVMQQGSMLYVDGI